MIQHNRDALEEAVSRAAELADVDAEWTRSIIPWSSPVPCFGDPSCAQIATLGLNPSNREFVDQRGFELSGADRRFHTLRSLRLRTWRDLESGHVTRMSDKCREYFQNQPYDRWFRVLDKLISILGVSYYSATSSACHLDLVPYATHLKWTGLEQRYKDRLVYESADVLSALILRSSIRVLILNGISVVKAFESLAQTELERAPVVKWSLPRASGAGVLGWSFRGEVTQLRGAPLGRPILVLGYNHNLQSSFGVTDKVRTGISNWIQKQVAER